MYIAAFDQGIQVSYSKENETVTLAFPEELKVCLIGGEIADAAVM